MTIGSLFAGIGGLELGLERAGLGPVMWQVEQDAFCRQVLAKHWPDADRSVTDVCEAGRANLEPVDIICGGFPCQDISYAGKGAGLDGERSGLWFEFARIVGELEPRIVVVENVSALLARGMGAVLGTLSDLGYDAIWTTIRAADVGAPHQRERVFVVAHARCECCERRGELGAVAGATRSDQGQGDQRQRLRDSACDSLETLPHTHPRRRQGEWGCGLLDGERTARGNDAHGCDGAEDVGDSASSRFVGSAWRRRAKTRRFSTEPISGREGFGGQAQPRLGDSADGLPNRVAGRWPSDPHEPQHEWEAPRTVEESFPGRAARLKALGNAVVPQCAETIGWVVRELQKGPR